MNRIQSSYMPVMCALLAFISACASASIQSNRDPNFRGKIAHILVLVAHSGHDDDAGTMATSLGQEFAERGVRTKAAVVPETTDISAVPYAPGTEAVLFVRATNATKQWYGETTKVGYDATLVLTADPTKRIWRAQVSHSGDGFMMDTRIGKAAARVVERLVEDRVL